MGFVLTKPVTEQLLRGRDCPPSVAYGSACMQGWRVSMEDAHTTFARLPRGCTASFFAVYDGHGGRIVSRYASRHVHLELLAAPAFAEGNIPEALRQAYISTDEKMLTEEGSKELQAITATPEAISSMEDPEEYTAKVLADQPTEPEGSPTVLTGSGMGNEANLVGCTAVSLYVDWDRKVMYCANSGDSRCVLCVKGVPEALSEDHKPDVEREKARIEKAKGFIRGGRVNANLNLTRTLGDFEYKRDPTLKPEEQIISCVPDVVEHAITEDCDFAVLGCDGIWDVLTNEACMNYIRKRLLPQAALTEEEKALNDDSRIQVAQDSAAAGSDEEKAPWPGDVAQSLDELLNMVAGQTMMHCLAPSVQCGIGCDNMTIIVVLFRESTFGKRVVSALNERLAKEKEEGTKQESDAMSD